MTKLTGAVGPRYHPFVIFLRKRRLAAMENARARLGGDVRLLEDGALFFGLQSRGAGQMRGNGCLAVSEREIFFQMWIPKRMFVVPRPAISTVERAKSHLGKRVGRPLLKISFTAEDGTQDSIAWLVKDLAAWEAELGVPGAAV